MMQNRNVLKKSIIPIILSLFGIMGISSCNRESQTLPLLRFEKVLFGNPPEKLHAIFTEDSTYNSPLLNIHPNNGEYMTLLMGFATDPTMQDIYRITDSCFSDLKWLEQSLNKSLRKAEKEHPDIHYSKLITLVSGAFDYSNRVFCTRDHLAISIDQYAMEHYEKYGYFGTPLYLIRLCDTAYMLRDCMSAIAKQYILTPHTTNENLSLLDHSIAEGKVLYFLDKVLPNTPEHIKIRYTPEQWKWMVENEKNVWSYLLQNDLLYCSDYNRFHNFIDDAPKTNAFRDSAPRTTDYIGWQIVKSYAERTKCTMKELFDNTSSQDILNRSAYHPS